MARRGRRSKTDRDQCIEDDAGIAAAVELMRRRFKPLRDQGHARKVGAFRFVATHWLGGRIGPDAVEQSYRRWRKGVRLLDGERLGVLAEAVRDKYNPPKPIDPREPFVPRHDPPFENPRHYRWHRETVFPRLKRPPN